MYTVTDCGSVAAGVLVPLDELLELLDVDAIALADAFPSDKPFEYPELYPSVFPAS